MSQEHVYDVSVQWTENRKGMLTSEVLENGIEVATPPQFSGGIDGVWSPEHLFVAAINSCLMTTFLAIAENSKLAFSSFTSKANGKLALADGKYKMTEVVLMPVVTVSNETDHDRALRILQKAEAACLISNSVNSKITLEAKVQVAG